MVYRGPMHQQLSTGRVVVLGYIEITWGACFFWRRAPTWGEGNDVARRQVYQAQRNASVKARRATASKTTTSLKLNLV